MSPSTPGHWDAVYGAKAPTDVSWYQADPAVSVRLVTTNAAAATAVVDVGGGASLLVDELVGRGYDDLTVVDISATALGVSRGRLAAVSNAFAESVTFVATDVLVWEPGRTFGLWHDRAVFHFLTAAEDRADYAALATRAVAPGGAIVMATFAPDGPAQCSGLDVCRYDAEGLAEQFAGAFVLEHTEHDVHRTPWDAPQSFTWVVLRRV